MATATPDSQEPDNMQLPEGKTCADARATPPTGDPAATPTTKGEP